MDEWLGRRPLLLIAGLAGAIVLVFAVLLGGGQTAQILSTVGASVGGHGDTTARQPAPDEGSTGSETTGSQPKPTAAPNAALAVAPAPGLLIVRTGTLRIQTPSVGDAVERASSVVAGAGGYVAGSKETGSGADAGATISVRIPATDWDRTLGELRGLGTVLGQEIGTEEVTGQVVDLDARIANLRASEAALQAIMAKATKISDVLDVQRQLTDTRGQIEQLTAQVTGLRDRAAFGSLTIQLSVPAAPRPAATPRPGWDPGRDVAAASAKLVRIGQSATSAGIWFGIIGIPILLAVAIGLGILRLGWLALRRTGLVRGGEPA